MSSVLSMMALSTNPLDNDFFENVIKLSIDLYKRKVGLIFIDGRLLYLLCWPKRKFFLFFCPILQTLRLKYSLSTGYSAISTQGQNVF
jgi:hypothetical protein